MNINVSIKSPLEEVIFSLYLTSLSLSRDKWAIYKEEFSFSPVGFHARRALLVFEQRKSQKPTNQSNLDQSECSSRVNLLLWLRNVQKLTNPDAP